MTKIRRTITIGHDLDEAISMLAVSNQMNYSEFVDSRLRTVPLIQQMIVKLEKLPELPGVNVRKLKQKRSARLKQVR
jgi:hypothetical protein